MLDVVEKVLEEEWRSPPLRSCASKRQCSGKEEEETVISVTGQERHSLLLILAHPLPN